MKEKIKINLLPNYFLKEDNVFDLDEALMLSGKIAGECYDEEGFEHILLEPTEKTLKRINDTLTNCHHSVYDHIYVSLNIQNIPKILAMVINNENQYTTAEKSARYTKIEMKENSTITQKEIELYNKWLEIFKEQITNKYENVYKPFKVRTLSQENARYLISVFVPTQMIYTTSLRQLNYLVSWMNKYINEIDNNDSFQVKLSEAMKDFISELNRLNLLEERLQQNEKNRSLSLFGKDLEKKEVHFGDVYSTCYLGSFAELAQAQRHRTLDYKMEILGDKMYFIPPIIEDNEELVNEWLNDIKSVSDVYPQGELVRIYECGKYDDFILKCKERLCSAAQLEIMKQTRDTLLKYRDSLIESNSYLAEDIEKYTKGARCTFSQFTCTKPCGFSEGINLSRKI